MLEIKNKYKDMLKKRANVNVYFKESDDMLKAYISITNEVIYITFVNDKLMLDSIITILPNELKITETSSAIYFETEYINVIYAL